MSLAIVERAVKGNDDGIDAVRIDDLFRILRRILIDELVQHMQAMRAQIDTQILLADDVVAQFGQVVGEVVAQHKGRGDDILRRRGDAQTGELVGIGRTRVQRFVADKERAFATLSQIGNGLHTGGQCRIAQIDCAIQIKDEGINFPFHRLLLSDRPCSKIVAHEGVHELFRSRD